MFSYRSNWLTRILLEGKKLARQGSDTITSERGPQQRQNSLELIRSDVDFFLVEEEEEDGTR